MLDSHPGLAADRLEADLDLGDLVGREARLAPGEGDAGAGLPGGDAADLEDLAIGCGLDEAAALAGLEGERAGGPRGELEQLVGPPPLADLGGEGLERARRRR